MVPPKRRTTEPHNIPIGSPEHIKSLWCDVARYRDFAAGNVAAVEKGITAQIVAVDPGGTTGYAAMRFDLAAVLSGKRSITRALQQWHSGQISGSENEQVMFLKNFILKIGHTAVVIESFQLRQMSAELSPVRVTAALEWALWQTDRVTPQFLHTVKQQPSMAKTTATDERLKRAGLYRAGEEHGRDAVRHAITYARRITQPGKTAYRELSEFATDVGFPLSKGRSKITRTRA